MDGLPALGIATAGGAGSSWAAPAVKRMAPPPAPSQTCVESAAARQYTSVAVTGSASLQVDAAVRGPPQGAAPSAGPAVERVHEGDGLQRSGRGGHLGPGGPAVHRAYDQTREVVAVGAVVGADGTALQRAAECHVTQLTPDVDLRRQPAQTCVGSREHDGAPLPPGVAAHRDRALLPQRAHGVQLGVGVHAGLLLRPRGASVVRAQHGAGAAHRPPAGVVSQGDVVEVGGHRRGHQVPVPPGVAGGDDDTVGADGAAAPVGGERHRVQPSRHGRLARRSRRPLRSSSAASRRRPRPTPQAGCGQSCRGRARSVR